MKIEEYGNLKPSGKSKEKKQIILTHTSRNVKDYLTSVSNRYNGKYTKIPNFVISKKGKIHKLLSEQEYSKYFTEELINKNSIIISLENFGDRKSTRLNSSHMSESRMPSSA